MSKKTIFEECEGPFKVNNFYLFDFGESLVLPKICFLRVLEGIESLIPKYKLFLSFLRHTNKSWSLEYELVLINIRLRSLTLPIVY